MSFTALGLSSPLAEASSDLGFSEPTPIQAGVIPEVLAGKDVLGIAKTGSGKTASYVLPILQKATSAKHREPEVLVLVPTRELADQVRQVFEQFLPALPERLRCLAIFGGVAINPQMQEVGKADIIVATPGRLLDLVSKNALTLSAVKTLVLDEADKMLNLGFKKEVDALIALLPTLPIPDDGSSKVLTAPKGETALQELQTQARYLFPIFGVLHLPLLWGILYLSRS
ncbi:DEAD/DEAH box helicase [Akkermansiaceae bacterium]|nr:DEAD/DEAH box helicase [Akkermansiaceae bacterium]